MPALLGGLLAHSFFAIILAGLGLLLYGFAREQGHAAWTALPMGAVFAVFLSIGWVNEAGEDCDLARGWARGYAEAERIEKECSVANRELRSARTRLVFILVPLAGALGCILGVRASRKGGRDARMREIFSGHETHDPPA